MEKTITINDKEYRFRVSAATTYLYREKFGKDLIRAFQLIGDGSDYDGSLELMTELAYIAAKQADKTIPDIGEWLEQFDTGELLKKVIPCVTDLWQKNIRTTVSPKK